MDYSIKKLIAVLTLIMGGIISIPAYAWPEVDHMNMCGSATKVIRGYSGSFRTWGAHDNYVSHLVNDHYLRNNCPNIVAPVKNYVSKKTTTKTVAKKSINKNKEIKRISQSSYDEKADCKRVDRLNGLGLSVQVIK